MLAFMLASVLAGAPLPQDTVPPPSLADLTLTPTRVVLDERRRSQELVLLNSGLRTTTYHLAFVQLEMAESGELRERPSGLPGSRDADALVSLSTTQATLSPGESQVIRLTRKAVARLEPGEYRSHLVLRAHPMPDAGTPPPVDAQPAPGVQVSLTPLYGLSVPVILRHQTQPARLTWVAPRVERGPQGPVLLASLARQGSQSAFGHVQVWFTPKGTRTRTLVGEQRFTALYAELPRRSYRLPLALAPRALGLLTLRFVQPDPERILAEHSMEFDPGPEEAPH